MKKILVFALCIMMLVTITACGGGGSTAPADDADTTTTEDTESADTGDKPLVGISVPEAPTGWVAAVQWTAKNKADELGLNYRLVASASTNDQANQLEELVDMGAEIIILFPHNDELAVAAQKVMDAGVTLINFDRTLGTTEPDYYVAGNNYNMGVAGAEYIIDKIGDTGKVVIVYTPNLGNIFEERKQGFVDGIEGTGIEVIGTYTPENASAEAGLAIMSDVLTQNPQIDAIYSSDDESSIGMLQAIKEAGRTDIKAITGGGGAQSYFNLFAQYPDIWASSQTYAPYMMNTCVEMAAGLLEGQTYDKETIVPTSSVDRDTYQDYLDANGITADAPY